MRVDILTLFPEMFRGPLSESLLKKAQEKGLLSFNLVNIRDFTCDKHKTADDSPYGGGAGMVMKADVISAAVNSVRQRSEKPKSGKAESRTILMCPTGKLLTQEKIKELAKEEHLILLCGHYEGMDERVRELADDEISIGDYVLTGGEIPAMALMDTVARQIPGVVKEEESVKKDSFYAGLLDHPSYTKPEDLGGKKVPAVLLSGDHRRIEAWRKKEALRKTLTARPGLLARACLGEAEKEMLGEILAE